MFDFLTNSIENALDVADGLLFGELPSKRQVAKLVADGVTVAAIASATGFGVEVIEELLAEDRS